MKHFNRSKKAGQVLVAFTMAAALTVPVLCNGLFTKSNSANAAAVRPEYTTKAALTEAQHKLNQQLVEEGTVLLKNNNNALPLAGNDKKVTVFHSFYNPEGWSQSEGAMVLSGGGSGNIWVSGSDCEDAKTTHGCHTLYNGLTDHGYNWNPALYDTVYFEKDDNWDSPKESSTMDGPKMDLIKAHEGSFADYNGTAIITISRIETESQDNYEPTMGGPKAFERDPANPSKHYLQLRDKEIELIEYAKTKFGKVVVLLNTACPLEIDYLKNSNNVDAVLWIGYPGETGLKDIPGVLDGSVSPSGRTVDTWVKDMSKDPTWQNFGDNSQTSKDLKANDTVLDKDGNIYYIDPEVEPGKERQYSFHSIDYAEGIYLGYRYYETKASIEGEEWYTNAVTYPFGYGLSYTAFEQKIAKSTTAGDKIELEVEVKNVGNVAGKEVVQVYYNPPYTEGGIEKSTANLVAFEKTELIQANQTQVVKISFDKRDMASWDLKNGNYILEAGDYEISINKDSHNKWDKITYAHDADTVYNTDGTTGTEYTKLFSGDDFFNVDKSKYTADGSGVNFMSRATGLQLPETAGNVKFSDEAIKYLDSQNKYVSTQDSADDPWVKDAVIPSTWTQVAKAKTTDIAEIQLSDMIGVEDEAKWTEFMNQLTWDEMKNLVSQGLAYTAALKRVGKPKTYDTDGPAQLGSLAGGRGFGWCAAVVISSTWNVKLAEEFGKMVGEEANNPETNGGVVITGWYGPGMNIHRNPYAGRNFEYYSEDGLLAGKIAAGAVKGAASKGLITYLKHLALNNQETNRTTNGGVCTWTNEQAMREIYLRPFELAVKEGGATGMMCAFNRIGGVPAGANYNLFVNLLEKEWGFDGLSVTDYYSGSSWGWPGNMVVRCHMFPMGKYADEISAKRKIDGTWNADKNRPVVDGNEQDALYYAVRTTAQRMFKAVANSNAFGINDTISAGLKYNVIQGDECNIVLGDKWNLEKGVDTIAIDGKSGESIELAPGTSYNPSTGDLTGKFEQAGTYEFAVTVTLNSDTWGSLKGTAVQSKVVFNVRPAVVVAVSTQFKTEDGKLMYKYSNEEEDSWKVVVDLSKFNVEQGETVAEIKISEDNELMYKYSAEGANDWKVIVDLKEFDGEQGENGPDIAISEDGYWVIKGVKTAHSVVPKKASASGCNGCNGSLDVVSATLTAGIFLVAGVVIFSVRRKKED